MKPADLNGVRVTVMGLGLHGGGIETARYLCRHGAIVTVTDTRQEAELAQSIDRLAGLPIRYVLGTHEERDFTSADFVVKNPAVPRNAPLLSRARLIETDISLFLRLSGSPLIAVTGTKGKSTTVSAIHHVLLTVHADARLGGNITVSPLTFVDEITEDTPVVLELSSFQLGDLALVQAGPDGMLLRPRVAAITNIMPDHQNYYHSMDRYVADKKMIYRNQRPSDSTVVNYDQEYGRLFASETPARPFFFSQSELPSKSEGGYFRDNVGYYRSTGGTAEIVPAKTFLSGDHARGNLLIAGLSLTLFGVKPEATAAGLLSFPGVEHRMEAFAERGGVRFINDSAATIPEASLAAARSVSGHVIMIAGGTDKELDFSLFPSIAGSVSELHLLSGTATDRAAALLAARGLPYFGPYDSLEKCIDAVLARCEPGTTVLFSPGCASFGMFLNEFDRGHRFKDLILDRTGGRTHRESSA